MARRVYFWDDEETEFMLAQLKEFNILKYIDGRKTRNGDLFEKVAQKLEGAGFKRTPEQIRVRWKHLKRAYYNAKNTNSTSGHNTFRYTDLLEELLGHRPLSQPLDHGVDVGFSAPVSESELGPEDPEETAQEPDEDEDSDVSERTPSQFPPRSSTPQLQQGTSTPNGSIARSSMARSRRKRRQVSDMEQLLDRMQQMQNTWMEQIQQSQSREEGLINGILQSNATVASALMEGIHRLQSSNVNMVKIEDGGWSTEQNLVHAPEGQRGSAVPSSDHCLSASPPCASSSITPAPPAAPQLQRTASAPAERRDAASFWKSCNTAGCTQAIFTDFINEMNNISGRIQSGQASQEDYDLALAVMEASGKLAELVTKQQEEMQRKQMELNKAAASMKEVVSAPTR